MKRLVLATSLMVVVSGCKSRSDKQPTGGSTEQALVTLSAGTDCVVETDSSVQALYNSANDPFKKSVLTAAGCKTQMAKKDPYSIDTFMQNAAGCKLGRRFIVSEKGQLSVSRETGTDPRTVDEWNCPTPAGASGSEMDSEFFGKVFISGPGSAMHIIAWDSSSQSFNFYSADHPTATGQIFFHGNSHEQATASVNSFRHSCTSCHVGGALLMKELRFPWPFWHAAPSVNTLPGVNTKQWSRAADANHPVEIAEAFEVLAVKSMAMANHGYIQKLKEGRAMGTPIPERRSGALRYRDLLHPLFCERGVGLASSPTSYPTGASVPGNLVLNRLLVPQDGRINLTASCSRVFRTHKSLGYDRVL